MDRVRKGGRKAWMREELEIDVWRDGWVREKGADG